MRPESALILGGGVAGLAAAYRLLQLAPHCKVTVLEGAPRPGGLASSWKCEDFTADLGPHRVYTELPEIKALLPELIADEQAMTVTRRSELLLDGHFYRYPVRATELLRVMGPRRMAALGWSAVTAKASAPFINAATYEEAMTAAFGRGAYRLILEPYTRKVWKTPPNELHPEIARVRVSAGGAMRMLKSIVSPRSKGQSAPSALSSFTYIRGGAEGLVLSLQRKVRELGGIIETDREVIGFDTTNGSVQGVHVKGEGEPRTADLFISTIPITDLVRQLSECCPHDRAIRAASGLQYLGLVLGGIALKRETMTPNCWLYFPGEEIIFNRAYEPCNFDPSMAPAGRTMPVFEVTARWNEPLWQASAEETAQAMLADALKLKLFREDEVEGVHALKVKHAYPLYTLDYQQRLLDINEYLSDFDNLLSTGRQGLFNHNNMDHSMLVGMRAAETALATKTDPAREWYKNLNQFSHFRIVD